jgi:DNA-binding transcriptional ArsR family regulator
MKKMKKMQLDIDKLECMASRLKAIGHPIRVAIVHHLIQNEKLTVSQIQKKIKIDQAATSNHLRILKDQSIVSSRREGKFKLYSLRQKELSHIIECMEKCD